MKPNQNNRRYRASIEAILANLREGQQALNAIELRLKADPALWDHLSPDQKAGLEMMRGLAKEMQQTQN